MSALALRLAALLLMLSDHIGFATGGGVLRIIGRLSWPIFAFLLANGFKYTKNVFRYAARLLLFAFVSEFIFDFFFFGEIGFFNLGGSIPLPSFDNIYFTLFAGLCFLVANRYFKSRFEHHLLLSLPTLLVISYVAAVFGVDYGALGVLWIGLFGMLDAEKRENRIPLAFGAILLSVWRLLIKSMTAALGISFNSVFFLNVFLPGGSIGFIDSVQPLAALSLVLIFLYNGKSGMPKSRKVGKALQYAFYAFYPLHILVLWVIFG